MTIGEKSAAFRASEIQPDGALKSVFGQDGPKLDQPLIVLTSGLIDLTSAADRTIAPVVLPFPCKIWAAQAYVVAAPDGGNATVEFGDDADADEFGSVSVLTTDSPGDIDALVLTAEGQATIAANTILVFSTDGNATSVGSAHATVLVTPAVG